MEEDLRALLRGAAKGDMDAFGEVYERLSVRVFNYARAITKNKEVSEDITHSVFLQIHNKAAKLAEMANPTAYIMTAARNHAYDYFKRSRHAAIPIDEAAETGVNTTPFDRMLIEDALMRLSDNLRETVYLHYICGFTQKETAAIMGVALATVKWRCKKAIKQLQGFLIEDNPIERSVCFHEAIS